MRRYELAPNGTQKVSMEKPLSKLTTPGMKRFTAITPLLLNGLFPGSLSSCGTGGQLQQADTFKRFAD